MSFDINKFSLENGLDVFHCKMPTNDISMIYGINAGSFYESAEQAGLAHLVEHVLFKGTFKRKNRDETYNEITPISSDFLCHSNWDNVELGIRILRENFEPALEFTEDILLNSMFTKDDIESEKRIVLDEMRISQDNNFLVYEYFKHLFEGNPRARPIIGYENTVLNLSSDEVKTFYQQHYVPSNMGLVVVGNIGLNYLKYCLENTFKGIVEFPKPELKEFKFPRNKEKTIFYSKKRENSKIILGRITPKITETYATNILNSILTRKIKHNLRDKYSTSYSSSSILSHKIMEINASCKKEHNKFVRDVIRNTIVKTKNGNFTEEDVNLAIKNKINSFNLNSQFSFYIAKSILNLWPNKLNNLDWLNTLNDSYKKITINDVKKVAQKYLSIEDLTTVILGDF